MRKTLIALILITGCEARTESPSVEFNQHAATVGPSAAELARMRAWLEDHLPDADVVNSFTTTLGDEVSCIPVRRQISLRNSMAPIAASPPEKTPPRPLLGDSMNPQGFGSGLDAQGRRRWCEPGTIPVRRYQLDELAQYPTLDRFLHRREPPMMSPQNNHKYAIVTASAAAYGGQAITTLWRPGPSGSDASIMQMWAYAASSTGTQTVELGWDSWMPAYNGNPRLFIYWTADNYVSTGCFNLDCPGFVQTNSSICLTCSYSFYGVPGGGIFVEKYHFISKQNWSGDWWIGEGNWIGYYPRTLFSVPGLKEHADAMDWGGEIATNTVGNVTQDMGNGLTPSDPGSAYMDYMGYYPTPGGWADFSLTNPGTSSFMSNFWCYSIAQVFGVGRGKIRLGGPGKGASGCP